MKESMDGGGTSAMTADEQHLRARIEVLEDALREFDTWSSGYLDDHTGVVGAGMHAETWPSLCPSAQQKMRRIVVRGRRGEDGTWPSTCLSTCLR